MKEKDATNQAKARGNARGKRFVAQPKAIAKKKVHRMESVAKPILFTAASKMLRKMIDSGINVTHGAHRLGRDAAGKLTKTKIPWSERSQRAVPGKERFDGDTIWHGRGSPFSTFAHEAGHADDLRGSAEGAERVLRRNAAYASHDAKAKWYKPRQAPSAELSRVVRGDERRANASAERMLREGGATDEYIQRYRNEVAGPLNSYRNAYKVSAPGSASAVPPPAAAPSNPVIPTASPSNPLAAPAPSANPGVPAQPVPLAPPPPSANPGAPIKPSLGGLGMAAAGVGAVGIGAGSNAASGDKPRRKQPFGFSSHSPLIQFRMLPAPEGMSHEDKMARYERVLKSVKIRAALRHYAKTGERKSPEDFDVKLSSPSPLIQFMQKWEKVVKSLPPDRAEGIIRTIARTVRPLKGGFVGDYTPSQRLLTRALYPKKIENLPEAIVRTKESLRDARIAGDNWNISPRKKLKDRALMKRGAKPSFAEARGLDPEEEVGIIHGGGEAHIRDFIAGKSRGYKLEGDRRTGIQVHPINAMGGAQLRDRTRFYANRASGMAYDSPAMLTGTVKRKHLVTANNSYEGAVVDPTHISRPKVRPLRRTEDRPSGEYWAEETASKIGTTEPIRKYVTKREQRLSSHSPLIQFGFFGSAMTTQHASALRRAIRDFRAKGGVFSSGRKVATPGGAYSSLKNRIEVGPADISPRAHVAWHEMGHWKDRQNLMAGRLKVSNAQGAEAKTAAEIERIKTSEIAANRNAREMMSQYGVDQESQKGAVSSFATSLNRYRGRINSGELQQTILGKFQAKERKFSSRSPLIQLASAAWQRKEGKSESGGLNRKGVASYRRENPGSKLKTAVTTPPSKLDPNSKAAKRRKSFCARMSGMQGPMKKPNGEPTRKALSLRKWNCSSKAPLIQLGVVSIGTAKRVLKEIRKESPWSRVIRPDAPIAQAKAVPRHVSQSAARKMAEMEGSNKITPGTLIIPRPGRNQASASGIFDMMAKGAKRGRQKGWRKLQQHADTMRGLEEPLRVGLHEHGHLTMPKRTAAAIGAMASGKSKAGRYDRDGLRIFIDEEYRANRDIAQRIARHGTPEELSAWKKSAHSQIRTGYQAPVFSAKLGEMSTPAETAAFYKKGQYPFSARRRVIEAFPELKRQQLHSRIRPIHLDIPDCLAMSNLRSLSARLDSILFATGISEKYLPGTVWDRDVEVRDEATGKKRKKPSLAKEYYKAVIKQTEPRKTSIKKNRGQPDWVGERGVDRKQNPDLFRTVTDSPVHHQADTHQWTSDSTGAKIGKPFQYIRRTIDDPAAPGGLRQIAPKDLLNTEGYRALRIKQMAKADEPKVRQGYSDAELDARNVPESKRELLRQGTDATRDPRTQGEIRVASRAIRKGLVSGDMGPEVSKMRTAIARDADINRRIAHRIRKEKGDPGFLRSDPKIVAISGGKGGSEIIKEDSNLLAAARKNFDTHLAGETERRKLQAGQISEMVRRRAHEKLVEQEHGPNWSTKLEGRSRAEAFAKYEKRAQDYASSITSSVPQRHDELAALIGVKPEGLEKVRENYNNLKESDYKTERKVQNRIINSGRIFDGSPAFSPEAPKPAVKAGYPNLKRLGIAGALVGGGLLARQLIKKRREKQEQEAQPQLMSSRIRAIRFGNKFPIPKAAEQKLSDLAQRLLRKKSGETDAREHLMSKVKVGRPAGPEQPAGQWDQVEAAQDLNPETIDIVTTAKKRLRKALQKPGGLKALKVEELIGEKTAAGMSPMDKGLFKDKKKKLESISLPMPTRGKRAAMAQGRTLPDAVERGDIEGVKTLFARQGPSKPPISVFKPGTVEREMVNPAPKMIPLTTEQAQLRMAIERVKRASVVRNLRNDKRGYIKRTGQDPDVAVNNARSAELIAKSNQKAAEESARTEILAARENAKAEIKKASQQAADYQEAALGKQAAINRTESEKARSRAFRNAAIGTGLGFTGGALIAGNASRQSYEPKKQLQQPIRKLLMSARSKPIAFDYGQPRRDYAKIGTDAALGAGLSVAGTGALLYGAGKVLNKRMPDLAHMLNTASKQHINVFRPSKVIPMVKAIPQASGLFGKQMKIVREGEEMIASGKFPDPEALKKRMSSAGVSAATAEEMKRFTKKHGRSPSDVMERSVGMLSGASSTIIGGLGGAALSPGWEKKNHKMSAISRMIRFARGERSETRKKSTLRHDIATGALEGLAVGPFMEPAFSYLQGEKVEPIMRSGFRGLARRALIGGAMGATTSAAIGMLVNAADKERRKELKRTGKPILFATPQAASPRGAIARDKYDNAVFDQDEVRAEKNYKRAALAGGGLAVLLRGPRTRLGTFLAGSGAGLGAQLVTRYITESSKDQFGDRSHLAKRIDRLPWQIPAAIAAGIIGKRAYKAGALKMSRKGKLIEFYSQEDMEQAIKSQKEDDRNWSRAKSQVSRATQGIKRGTRLTQDLIRSAKGQKNLDSRGRERKREWDKPWVRNALTGAIAVGTVAGFNKIIKGTGPSSALGRAKEMWHRGTFRNYAREKIPGFKKVNDWFRGFKKNATAEAGEAVENSGLLHRMLNRVQKGSGEVGRQPVQVAGKGGAVTTLNPGTTAYNQHMKKTTPESEKAAAKEVADAESAEAKKLKNIQAGGLYELSSRLDSILFAEEDWEDRRDGDLVLTKIRRRKRDLKPTLKRKDWQDAVVIPAMLGGSLLTGALGARLLGPRIAAAGAEVSKSARRNVQTKDLRDEMKRAVGMQSRSPLVALNARLARLEFGTRTLASGHVVTWGKDLTLGKAYKKVARDNRGAYRITDPETKAEITVHRSRGKEMPEGKFVRGAQSEKWWKGKNAMISLMKVPKGNRKGDGLSNRGGRAMVEILGGTRKSGDQLVHTGLLGHFDKRGITARSVASDYQKRGLNAIAEGTADRVGMYQRKGFKIDHSRVPDELGMSVIRRPGAKRNEPISKEKFYKIPSKYRQKEIKTATGALVDHFENIPGKRLVATSAAIGGTSLLSGSKREKSTAEKVIDAATIGAGVPATYMAGKYIYDNAENIGSNIKIAAKNASQEAVIRPALRGTGNTKKIADAVFRKGATLLARR